MGIARILVTTLVSMTSGCNIGIPSEDDPSNSTIKRCDTDADCNDGNVCTVDECSDGFCSNRSCGFGEYCDLELGGCVRVPGDPCLSQCDLGLGPDSPCPNRPLDEFEDFDTLREQWLNEEYVGGRLAGHCADGTRFLTTGLGGVETRYFDGTTGEFLALRILTDASDIYCCGVGYWPYFHECDLPIVEEVISGTDSSIIGSLLPPYATVRPCVDPAVPCTESMGECMPCTTHTDCDDGDPCSYDSCATGTCWAAPMTCPDPE